MTGGWKVRGKARSATVGWQANDKDAIVRELLMVGLAWSSDGAKKSIAARPHSVKRSNCL